MTVRFRAVVAVVGQKSNDRRLLAPPCGEGWRRHLKDPSHPIPLLGWRDEDSTDLLRVGNVDTLEIVGNEVIVGGRLLELWSREIVPQLAAGELWVTVQVPEPPVERPYRPAYWPEDGWSIAGAVLSKLAPPWDGIPPAELITEGALLTASLTDLEALRREFYTGMARVLDATRDAIAYNEPWRMDSLLSELRSKLTGQTEERRNGR